MQFPLSSRVPFRRRKALVVVAVVAAVTLSALPAAAAPADPGGPGPVLVDAVNRVIVGAHLRAAATEAAAHIKVQGASVHTFPTPQELLLLVLASRPKAAPQPIVTAQPKPVVVAPVAPPVVAPRPVSGTWAALAQCESGGNWSINTGSFDGGLQFLPSTWRAYGGGQFAPFAYEATPSQQIAVAERVLAATGGNYRASWPACSRKLGL